MRKLQTVLITGASSGIGFELAKIFANNNYNIVLIAKDKEKLLHAAHKLKKDNVSVWFITKDLSDFKTPTEIYRELQDQRIIIDILVNNAGFATYGLFTETDLQEELNELQVNIVALTHLTKLFVRGMVKKNAGKILNVASTAAFLPGPLMAVYYASKAYVLSFSEALVNELEGTGVTVSVLCPGTTNTGFEQRAHLEQSKLFQRRTMKASNVAQIAYDGLMQGKTIIIPGLMNRIMVEATRLAPRSIAPKVVRKLQEKRDE